MVLKISLKQGALFFRYSVAKIYMFSLNKVLYSISSMLIPSRFLVFSVLDGIILPSITYDAKPRVAEIRVESVIQFPNSYFPGLRHEGHLDNCYNFSKESLIILEILYFGKSVCLSLVSMLTYLKKTSY